MSNLKSKHAFGSEQNVDAALKNGLIDPYDILFLNEGKIGWVDKDGNIVMVKGWKKQIVFVESLPETGDNETVYVFDNAFHYWNGSEFITAAGGSSVTETVVETKVETAKAEAIESANAYTDAKLAEASHVVVEF